MPEYLAAFKRMVGEFGEDRVNLAVTRAIDNTPDFAPTPAKIRQYIMPANNAVPTCKLCADTEGWIVTSITSRLTGKELKAVERCDHSEGTNG